MEENYRESVNLLEFLFQNRKKLILITILGALLSIGASLLIDDKYKGVVVLYPSATNSISKALLSDTYGGKADILEFGEEEQAEQLLQILNSAAIRDEIIKKYDLMNHYEIDSTDKYKRTKLFKEYEDNISFKRNEYMAVEIEVFDTDPQMAANIANDISELLDSAKTVIHKSRAIKGFKIVEKQYNQLKKEIGVMEDSLSAIMSKGVLDVQSQSEVFSQEYAKALIEGKKSAANEIDEKLQTISKYGAKHIALSEVLENERKQLSEIKAKYEEAKVDAFEKIPNFFRTEKAYAPEKKSKPVRSIIVIVSTLATFLLATFLLIVLEQFKQLGRKN